MPSERAELTWEQVKTIMTTHEVLDLLMQARADLVVMMGQREKVVGAKHKRGEFADPEWFARVKSAIRHRQYHVRMLEERLRDLRLLDERLAHLGAPSEAKGSDIGETK